MKKILYSLFAVLAVSFALVSCGDDDNGTAKHDTLPEDKFSAMYSGTWTTYNADGTTVEKEGEAGTFIVAKGDVNYSAKLTFTDVTTPSIDASDVVVNIVWSGDNAKFFSTATALPINGEITSDGKITAKFSKTVRQGKSTKTNFYAFSGQISVAAVEPAVEETSEQTE